MKNRAFVTISSIFLTTTFLFTGVAGILDGQSANASKLSSIAVSVHQQPSQAPAVAAPKKAEERARNEQNRREELSKRLEQRREELKVEKKEKAKKEQISRATQKAGDED